MAVNIGVNIQRSPNRINQALRDAGVNGQYPKLLFDFDDEYYLTNGSSKTFANAMTFARAGLATMVDSDGLIKWAPHNLLSYSEQFDNAFWVKTDVTVTANSSSAPDGTNTADTITPNTANTGHLLQLVVSNSIASFFTESVFVKANGYSKFGFREGSTSGSYATFDLSDGSVIEQGSSTAAINEVGNGWFLCSFTYENTGGNHGSRYYILDESYSSGSPLTHSFTGDGTSGVYIWGAHLYRSDLGGMVAVPKNDRAFTSSNPTEVNTSATVTGLIQAAVGYQPQKLLFETTIAGRMLGDITNDGSVGTADASRYNYYRVGSATAEEIAYIEGVMHPYMLANDSAYYAYIDYMESAFYVPTTSSAVYLPRRGHHKYNGDQWVNKGILVESEARTNLITYANPTNGQWTVAQGTLTENAVTSPDGQTSASSFVTNTNNAEHYTEESLAVTSGTTYTFSIYLKDNGYGTGCLRIPSLGFVDNAYFIFDFNTAQITTTVGTMDAYGVEKAGNGWVRAYMTRTSDASTSALFRVHVKQPTAFVGDGLSGIYLYGGMVEAATTPSSYIPTNGSSVTRAAETVTVPYANLPWPTPTYIGDELVTNGTFDTSSNWVLPTGFSIGSGVMSYDGTGSAFSYTVQPVVTTVGKVYAIDFDTTAISGSLAFGAYKDTTILKAISSTGHTTVFFVATATTTNIIFKVQSDATKTFSIDNVSVREINPLSVSIAMQGEMDYADTDTYATVQFYKWIKTSDNFINATLTTNSTGTGRLIFIQEYNSDYQQVDSAGTSIYTPNINVPYSIAGRHGSNFLNVGAEGISYTANTNIDGLPELSTADFNLALDYMGTVSEFRIFDRDIGDTGITTATEPSLEASLSLTFDGQPSSFTNTGVTV